jgi:polygalacturonase
MKIKSYLQTVLILMFASAACLTTAHSQQPSKRSASAFANAANVYNVKTFGARGDGQALDTPAINRAIDAAAKAGGGTVFFPAGSFLSVSIHLKSNITLYLDQGSTIVAADPAQGFKYG